MKGKKRHAPIRSKGGTDWKRIARPSDAEIERMAARDADNPATTKADWATAFIGAPPLKTPVNAKFDIDVVEWFRSQGRGYIARQGECVSCHRMSPGGSKGALRLHHVNRTAAVCSAAVGRSVKGTCCTVDDGPRLRICAVTRTTSKTMQHRLRPGITVWG